MHLDHQLLIQYTGCGAISFCYDTQFGVSDTDWDVVQMKKAMIESTRKTVCLSISEKLNTLQPIRVCQLKEIDMLITELPADDPILKPYVDAGITVL